MPEPGVTARQESLPPPLNLNHGSPVAKYLVWGGLLLIALSVMAACLLFPGHPKPPPVIAAVRTSRSATRTGRWSRWPIGAVTLPSRT